MNPSSSVRRIRGQHLSPPFEPEDLLACADYRWSYPPTRHPGVKFSDGPRGFHGEGATTFPQGSARGASWDPSLEERIGDAMGREARALGSNMIGAPCINLARHPAWGRAQEGYGEDSHLLGEMGAALVRGIQRHVMACPKHFALNSMENGRFKVDVTADARTLHEVYLPHFKRVVDQGAASLMSAYNSVNGEWASQNKELLTGILQDQWDFQGFVQSDWVFAVRDAKKAALAGQHLEMPFANVFHRFLPDLIENGEVPESVADDAALRILRQLVTFAQGRDPGDYTRDVIGCEAHRRLAREAEQKSIVLLKNEGGVLPLHDVEDVTVIGQLADIANIGDHGSSTTQPPHVTTLLQGLRAAYGAPFRVQYEEGGDPDRAAAAASFCDVAVVVVGYTFRDEGEFLDPGGEGPWTDHLPKTPEPHEEAVARRLADGEWGATLRFYDEAIDAWRSTWIGPRKGVVMPFLARSVGDEIVLEGSFEEGVQTRWIFSEITPDSFSWRAVESKDEGESWTLLQEMEARRRSP